MIHTTNIYFYSIPTATITTTFRLNKKKANRAPCVEMHIGRPIANRMRFDTSLQHFPTPSK